MHRHRLGSTSLVVSPVALGTMTFGAQVDEPSAASMFDLFLDHGANFIDTANVYTSGTAEEILGRILKGRRDSVVLATKVGIKNGPGASDSGLSRTAILKGIDDSLGRLQTDFIDLFYLHLPDYAVPLEESLEALDVLVRAGKVRHLGASNYASWQLCHMLWIAEKMSFEPVRVAQPMYNLLARGIEQEFVPMSRQFGIALVPYNPLAGGLLTGKHRPDQIPAGTRFDRMPVYRDRYWNQHTFDAVEKLAGIARDCGKDLIDLAFSWLMTRPTVSSVIVGASSLSQLQQNLTVAHQSELSNEVLTACDGVWNDLRGANPVYNR